VAPRAKVGGVVLRVHEVPRDRRLPLRGGRSASGRSKRGEGRKGWMDCWGQCWTSRTFLSKCLIFPDCTLGVENSRRNNRPKVLG
jgi:hypothetical protein